MSIQHKIFIICNVCNKLILGNNCYVQNQKCHSKLPNTWENILMINKYKQKLYNLKL